MAAPAPNSMAAMAINQFTSDHQSGSCLDDPNFATVCSFIEQFGDIVKIGPMPFDDLQLMLENTTDVPLPLVQLHITLLRRVFKAVTTDKWERSLAKFGHTYCSQDAWEIERFGYKKAKIQTKLRLLKNLVEAQFDFNVKFKAEVNKLQAADLRLTPLGRDTEGQVYWYQVDSDANLRVYREDIDDETWEIVASSRDELENLISQLQRGEVRKPEPEEAVVVPEEDSNGKDIEPKEIILDTGKVEEDVSNAEESEDSDEDSDELNTEFKPSSNTSEPINGAQPSSIKAADKSGTRNDLKSETMESKSRNETPNTIKSCVGLKLVFGIKSKPKLDTILPQEDNKNTNLKREVLIKSPLTVLNALKEETPNLNSNESIVVPPLKLPSCLSSKTVKTDVDKLVEKLPHQSPKTLNSRQKNKKIKTEVESKFRESVQTKFNERTSSINLVSKIQADEICTPRTTEFVSLTTTVFDKNLSCVPKPLSDVVPESTVDCHALLNPVANNVNKIKTDEDLLQLTSSDHSASSSLLIRQEKLISEPGASQIVKVPSEDKSACRSSDIQVKITEKSTLNQNVEAVSKVVESKSEKFVKSSCSDDTGSIKAELVSRSEVSAVNRSSSRQTETSDKYMSDEKITSVICKTETDKVVEMDTTLGTYTESKEKLNIAEFDNNSKTKDMVLADEKPITKSEAWICGSEVPATAGIKSDRIEEKVIAEKAWICGSEVPATAGIKSDRIEEKVIAEKAWICGSEVPATAGIKSDSIEEKVIAEKAWVCGNEYVESTSVRKEEEKVGAVKELPITISEAKLTEETESAAVQAQSKTKCDASSEKCKDKKYFKLSKHELTDQGLNQPVPCNEPKEVTVESSANISSVNVDIDENLLPPSDNKNTSGILEICKNNTKSPETKTTPERTKNETSQPYSCTKSGKEKGEAEKHISPTDSCKTYDKRPECTITLDSKPEDSKAASSAESSLENKEKMQSINVDEPVEMNPSGLQQINVNSSSLVSALYSESSEDGSVTGDTEKNVAETAANVQSCDTDIKKNSERLIDDECVISAKNENDNKSTSETGLSSKTEFSILCKETAILNESANNTKVKLNEEPVGKKYVITTLEEKTVTYGDLNEGNKAAVDSSSNVGLSSGDCLESKSSQEVSQSGSKFTDRCINVKAGVQATAVEEQVSDSDSITDNALPVSKAAETSLFEFKKSNKLEENEPVKNLKCITTELPSVSDISAGKRKAEETIISCSKIAKLDAMEENTAEESVPPSATASNPIIGETIEEVVMTITGEGCGALNEGSNENSPAPLAADIPESHEESLESEESRDAFSSRGRGVRSKRGRRGRPPGPPGGGRSGQPNNASRNASRGLREVARLGASVDVEVNGDRENERPVRASRRIAQIRLKEEEERRKLEEERLVQLKEAQIQKKAKQEEKDKNKSENFLKPFLGKKSSVKKSDQQQHPDYVPSGSESEENSEDDDESEDFGGKGVKRRNGKKKNGKAKKGGNPWATSSEDEEDEAVEEEEEYHYEEEEEELVFKSDHEFSPESDLGEDDDVGPSRHARTAKQDKGDKYEEGNCCKCGKGDHPEWILLCDKCDKGWHASCLRPQLWVVPEGEWFCPPCQHNMLVENLNKNLLEYEGLLKRRENEILRKQRLAYVGISLNNVLPEKEKQEKEEETEPVDVRTSEKKKHRRRILSDEEEELSDFINDNSDDNLSRSRSNSSDSEDEPVYRLRARRTKKAFDFKEYDDMINSALRADDDDEEEEEEADAVNDELEQPEAEAEADANGSDIVNGETEETHSGKNEAYLKHLEEQAQEEEETDEELLDEKERLRRRELKRSSHRKTRRRINDLDAYSEEDSDDDFKASEAEDDEEELGDAESEWSGDKMEEDSDDSIALRARRKERHGRLGRREKYSDKGLVRRSTRKRKSRISYDESDDEDDEEDKNDKWQSGEESDESESNSESDDATWGKRKKKSFSSSKPKMPNFFVGSVSGPKAKVGIKKKKRKTDEDDVDRAWNNARGRKQKDEPVERRTRGRKINFKDILDSGESDDEGNVRPKRRPLSDSDDSRSPSCSRKLAEEIRAENLRQAKEYEERQTKKDETITNVDGTETPISTQLEVTSESPTMTKLQETPNLESQSPKATQSPSANQLPAAIIPSPVSSPVASSASPIIMSPISLPISTITNPPPLTIPSLTQPIAISKNTSLAAALSSGGSITSSSTLVGTQQSPSPPEKVLSSSCPRSPPSLSLPPNISPINLHSSSLPKVAVAPMPQPVPVLSERKSSKQSKSSRGSRGSSKKSTHGVQEKQPTSDPETSVSKSVKSASISSKSSKKRESTSLNVPTPNLLLASGGLPEILGQTMGLPLSSRTSGTIPNSAANNSKKGSGGSSVLSPAHAKTSSSRSPSSSQQTPPPVAQNLSASIPVDIDRVPNPALYAGNPSIRPFPMWVRNPGPPPPIYSTTGVPVPTAIGKPPPLSTSPFASQQGSPRQGYPSPPPLRIPNPNTSPLQAFQHFKRDSSLGSLYRLSSGQPQPGVPLASILPPGMLSAGPERFFGAPGTYGHPYGMLPAHTQGQHPQPLFNSPFDYRTPESSFKEEPTPPRTSASSLPTPVSSASSSPPPTTAVSVPLTTKDEAPTSRDSEFGGLVSYFSSQRSEEDMDT